MSEGTRIVSDRISRAELTVLAEERFGDMVKAVVDVDRRIMAVGGELHSDQEAQLLEDGARQSDLWGINLYPAEAGEEFIVGSEVDRATRQRRQQRRQQRQQRRGLGGEPQPVLPVLRRRGQESGSARIAERTEVPGARCRVRGPMRGARSDGSAARYGVPNPTLPPPVCSGATCRTRAGRPKLYW